MQRETDRADGIDHDLDAAIEAHAMASARMEAEAECRRQTTAAAAAKELAEVRALLGASVARPSRLGMQLDAGAAENGTWGKPSAAHAEIGPPGCSRRRSPRNST